MDISVVLNQMLVLFLLMAAGYAANRLGVLDAQANKLLSRMMLHLAMPALICSSLLGGGAQPAAHEVLTALGAALCCYLLSGAVALLLPRLLRAPTSQTGVYRFMLVFSNVGFMGYPVVNALYGAKGLFYASLFNLVFNLLLFSAGVLLLAGAGAKRNIPRLLCNFPLAVSVAAVGLYFAGFRLPGAAREAMALLGGMTTPASMMVIGSSLAGIPFSRLFAEWRIAPVALFRLFALPALVFFVLRGVISDPMLLGIAVLLTGMPVAANATMLCMQYGADEELASAGVFLTTLLSVGTIPLLFALLLS